MSIGVIKADGEFEKIDEYVKEYNLMVPFVSATWEEIDTVLAQN
jgi:hypothetical protein